jgi:hypothetical protein
MAVTAQEQLSPGAPEPTRPARPRVPSWPKPSQFQSSIPVMRLLAEIWAIPQVCKVGLLIDGSGIYVHVLMPKDDRKASHQIYDAERRYLNATALHPFELRVTPISRLPTPRLAESILAGFETILER